MSPKHLNATLTVRSQRVRLDDVGRAAAGFLDLTRPVCLVGPFHRNAIFLVAVAQVEITNPLSPTREAAAALGNVVVGTRSRGSFSRRADLQEPVDGVGAGGVCRWRRQCQILI